tara:strand:- start:3150 stop:5126 length:1977 start_codon:yes stop_codon:yes gene_type:complete
MNIIDIQDQLKNFSEQQLISEMQMPTGSAPQFLVLSEIKRRKRVRDDFMKREAANQPTVAQEAIAAAGVPQSGIMGMSEAMAPQAAVAEGGIGSIMPQSMRPQTMPAPTDDAIPMAEGGIIYAQKGTYFPSTQELYGIYGQESGFGKNLFGSSGEIGPYQIRPTTAIMPGFGITSMFPELEAAVARGDYANAQEAYLANKDVVDEALMSGQRSEGFVKNYLDAAESELGDRNKALLAFNQGIPGTRNFEGDASDTDYVSGVLGNQSGYQEAVGKNVLSSIASTIGEVIPGTSVTAADLMQKDQKPGLFSASASTLTSSQPVMSPPISDSQTSSSPYSEDDKINIINGINIAMGPMAIRGLGEQYYGKDPDIDAALLARGYNPGSVAAVTTETTTAANDVVLPSGETIEAGGEIKAGTTVSAEQADDLGVPAEIVGGSVGEGAVVEADKLQETSPIYSLVKPSIKDMRVPTDEPETEITTDSADETTEVQQTDEPNITFSTQSSEATSSLQQEILDLQEKMKKDRDTDKYLALAQAGLALMSSKEPTLLGAIGEAGVSGLQAYREAQDRYNEGVVDLINARAKLAKSGADPFDASNAVARLNAIDRALDGSDATIVLDEERKAKLLNERLVLSRFLEDLGLPGFATGSKPLASQATPAS